MTLTGRSLLHFSNITQFFSDSPHDVQGNFRIMDLPAPELDADIDLFIFLQPPSCVPNFEISMMLGGLGTQANFFDLDSFLGFFRFLTFLLLFVKEFPQIHHLTNRRVCVRCDFDEVQVMLPSCCQSFFDGVNTSVLTFEINHTNLFCPNVFIRSVVGVCYFLSPFL